MCHINIQHFKQTSVSFLFKLSLIWQYTNYTLENEKQKTKM